MSNENSTTTAGARTQNQSTEITARAKAFSGQGVREHRFLVSEDGAVRVWDSVAGYFTACHSLSASAQARIRKMVA
jgi:hypothetical protein